MVVIFTGRREKQSRSGQKGMIAYEHAFEAKTVPYVKNDKVDRAWRAARDRCRCRVEWMPESRIAQQSCVERPFDLRLF